MNNATQDEKSSPENFWACPVGYAISHALNPKLKESTNGARIEGENFMADLNVLVGRKRISAPNGKVVGFMDITLMSITPTTFAILSSSLLKKAPPPRTEKQP